MPEMQSLWWWFHWNVNCLYIWWLLMIINKCALKSMIYHWSLLKSVLHEGIYLKRNCYVIGQFNLWKHTGAEHLACFKAVINLSVIQELIYWQCSISNPKWFLWSDYCRPLYQPSHIHLSDAERTWHTFF